MKFKDLNLQAFDVMVDCIDLHGIQAPPKRIINNPIKFLWYTIRKTISRITDYFFPVVPTSLTQIKIGTFFNVCNGNMKPSEIIDAICEDLGFHICDDETAIRCWNLWNENLKTIAERFEKAQAKLTSDGPSSMYWNQANENHKIPASWWIIDSLAKRFGITYEQAYNMKIGEAIIALNIDATNAEYENKMNEYYKHKK